jgi:general secretion pathway protein M
VLIGAVLVCLAVLFGGIILPLESAVSTAVKTAATRREDLAWMHVNAPEIRAGGASLAPDTGEAPVVLVDRVGREAGLGNAMRGTQPSGAGVRVQLEAAPFDTLVTWLATLEERYGLAIESISVDRAARPGLVNANITFIQARH